MRKYYIKTHEHNLLCTDDHIYDVFLDLCAHRRFEEDRLIVVDVRQRHLQRLCGLIRHWLAHVTGHNNKLREQFAQG